MHPCLAKARPHLSDETFRRITAQASDALENEGIPEQTAISRAAQDLLAHAQDRLEQPQQSRARDVTETPKFKRWFGDSKVVDDEGEPLIVYHGTTGDFAKFKEEGEGRAPLSALGFYFTGDPALASKFARKNWTAGGRYPKGANVKPVYLSLQNPVTMSAHLWMAASNGDSAKTLRARYEKMGYDGIIVTPLASDPTGELHTAQYIAFHPEQIKSAIGNNGSFDPQDKDITRSTARPVFYSQLQMAIEQMPKRLSTMSAPQWKLWLDANAAKVGVKKEEIEWSGIKDYLAMRGKDKVTSGEISAYLRDNGIRVKDVVLGAAKEKSDLSPDEFSKAKSIIKANDYLGFDTATEALAAYRSNPANFDLPENDRDRLDAILGLSRGSDGAAKFASYTIPGGENYREVLITLPTGGPSQIEKMSDAELRALIMRNDENAEVHGLSRSNLLSLISNMDLGSSDLERLTGKNAAQFKSSHWDQPNVLAHLRVDDRTDAEGKRVLFVNEIQSDWAQEGRKKGFDSPLKTEGWTAKRGEGDPASGPVWEVRNEHGRWVLGIPIEKAQTPEQAIAYAARKGDAERGGNQGGLPSAPFVTDTKSWVSLALKRAIMMAIDGGYDKVAFVRGEQAADFFDLSKKVDEISYEPTEKGFYINVLAGGSNIKHGDFTAQELEDIVGKDIVQKMLDGHGDPEATTGQPDYEDLKDIKRLRGNGLKIEATGMRRFYDKIVPQVANDILKKLGGGKVGEIALAKVGARDKEISYPALRDDLKSVAKSEMGYDEFFDANPEMRGVISELDLEALDNRDPYNRSRTTQLISGLVDKVKHEMRGSRALKQTGFEITDEMRGKASDGMPLFSAARAARDLDVGFGYKVSDLFDSSKKVTWWDKSVGTPYHLAQKYPETFGRVYNAIQGLISDTSKYATRAADMAPNILPKLENMKDVFKSPLSAQDVTALSDPIFKGTLVYTRNDQGEVVEAEDVGTAGIVWTNDELRSMWNLDDRQIGLYREFRKATNKSIADLAITGMVRLAGKDADGVRGRVLAATNIQAAADILANHLGSLAGADPERANTLQNTSRIVQEQADQARGLMAKGYAPLTRFGGYTVYAPGIEDNGYFEMFESERDANKRARELQAEFPGQSVTVGTMSQEGYKLFKGVTPETLALFGDALGLDESASDRESQVFQEYLKLTKSTRSAMKRLIHRKGVSGYSNDVGRVLASFVYSNGRQAGQNLNAGEILKSANEVPEGDLKDHAIKLAEYSQNPQEEMQAIRGLVFAQFIGGNVASALVNTTQSLTTTWPTLSQHFGMVKSGKAMADALSIMKSGAGADTDLEQAMDRAAKDGITDPNETHQLQGQAQGRGSLRTGDGTKVGDTLAKLSNGLEKIKFVWGKGFGLAETLNRKIAFISAYKLARDNGNPNPYEFATKVVNDTQFVMNKGANPVWARGPVGATLFQFKKFSVFYLENLARMWGSGPEGKKAFAQSLAIMFVLAGAGGFPFADDLDDVIDGFAQRVLNKSFSSKMAKKEFFSKIFGDAGSEFVLSGVSGLSGMPIDISGRLGLGNLIPATGLLVKKQNYGQDVQELFGAVGASVGKALQGVAAASNGDVGGLVDGFAPVAVANALKAKDMIELGQYRDTKGRKVIDTTVSEALLKGIGFQPTSVKNVQDAAATQNELIGLNKARQGEIADLWARGRIERKPELVDQAKQQLKDWNAENPDSPITLGPDQINSRVKQANMTKAQRMEKTAPKQIRAGVKKALEPTQDQ